MIGGGGGDIDPSCGVFDALCVVHVDETAPPHKPCRCSLGSSTGMENTSRVVGGKQSDWAPHGGSGVGICADCFLLNVFVDSDVTTCFIHVYTQFLVLTPNCQHLLDL